MTSATRDAEWLADFIIQSSVDLDFVIGQDLGLPVGMTRTTPPELRRRVLAAVGSYLMQLSSIDYTLKKYVDADQYENAPNLLGDQISDFLEKSTKSLTQELRGLHTQEGITFGIFGSEITLFRVPEVIDTARILANRGHLLEVLPLLRLALEMTAWAYAAFNMKNENEVRKLKAQGSISRLKLVYETSGEIYGCLSEFSHWRHAIHSHFLTADNEHVAVLHASRRYRAMSLLFCLLTVDIVVEVARALYSERAEALVVAVQGVISRGTDKQVHNVIDRLVQFSGDQYFKNIQLLLR